MLKIVIEHKILFSLKNVRLDAHKLFYNFFSWYPQYFSPVSTFSGLLSYVDVLKLGIR